ncbi:MAG TPA: phosphatidate cytidylyltransferase [Gammaproteobacteria bacterium]|nr:phosphatidate cytidylyltransferase [Gammaproteobacteria bacterium]
MLRQRLLTAAILIPLVIGAIFALPDAGFVALLALFVLAGAWEWTRICGLRAAPARGLYLLIFALCLWLLRQPPAAWLHLVLGLALLGWAAAIPVLLAYARGRDYLRDRRFVKLLIGFFLLLPPFVALAQLRADPRFGPAYVLLLLLLIWTADSAAYFSGRRFGRRKLLPAVSPGKSWEGVAGALLATLALGVAAAYYFALPLAGFVLLALMVTLVSILGDLSESLFKRQAGLKDSGRLLPGHGGVLDRIDSLTSAAPLFLAGMLWITERA